MRVAGNLFVVTGGSSGLGAATVARLVADGGKALILDRNPPTVDHGDAADRVRFVAADVTDPAGLEAALDAGLAGFGEPRGLVCCAGVELAERLVGRNGPHGFDSFAKVIQVNLVGTFNALRLVAARMSKLEPLEEGERGVVVATASIAAFEGQVGQAAYAASKGGIVAMTLPAARELARFGVRVLAIAPGIFDTPLMGRLGAEVRQSLEAAVPFPPRFGQPAEFADLVAAILANRMLNGEVIRLDGALRMAGK